MSGQVRKSHRKVAFRVNGGGAAVDKPFKTVEEQIELLAARNLKIDKTATEPLLREGYYSVVNGYRWPFISSGDTYVNGASFDDMYRLFIFDRDLRGVLMLYFSMAEATLKATCSYVFSQEHQDEPNAYLVQSNYRADGKYPARVKALINDFNKILAATGRSRSCRDYLAHYVNNHDNVPFWVLTNYLMLGQIFKFYEYQTESVQKKISMQFARIFEMSCGNSIRLSPRKLRLVYDYVKDFRNICAHDERLYCSKVSPSRDIRVADVMGDLAFVLPKTAYGQMKAKVVKLVQDAAIDLGEDIAGEILRSMGFASVEENAGCCPPFVKG